MMATVFLVWELGGGLGHLMHLRPLAQGLLQQGHQVYAALRDLSHARVVFGERVRLLQAPLQTRPPARDSRGRPVDGVIMSFPHLLRNVGWNNPDELCGLAEAWRNLYELVKPDVIVFDHSPTALLAARGMNVRRVVVGTGFFIPPDEFPMRNLRPWDSVDLNILQADEDRILQNANGVLDIMRKQRLARLSRLYAEVDEQLFFTFHELDHYGARPGVVYRGIQPPEGGQAPIWRNGRGKRVYAYLKPFPLLSKLLETLNTLQCPTIVHPDGIDVGLMRQMQSPTLRFETRRLDMSAVARECDLGILNANHATTASLLLGGKPTLHFPLHLEQALVAKAVSRIGAGLEASAGSVKEMIESLRSVFESPQLTAGARAFAGRYGNTDFGQLAQDAMNRLHEIVNRT